MLRISGEAELQCRFMSLPTHQQVYYMIILEDSALYNQRLQQSKLASLGRLTASIAHEIRNPLGAISHAGQLLSECTQLTGQDLRLTKIITSNSGRVNQIIEDILNLSRRTDSTREKIELVAWLGDYLDNYYIEHAAANGKFKLLPGDAPRWVFIDPAHLKQIMDNLCQNALRYGHPEKGTILIQLQENPHEACIEIIDNGSGITPEHLRQLFEPFFTTSPSGTGLGLYISKELAELNQAKLSYYLTDDKRSCFRLCLQDANLTTIEL
jgi:two-component system sensor histidine kinase PilS (NtrC family)